MSRFRWKNALCTFSVILLMVPPVVARGGGERGKIDVEKATNGEDADAPTGPVLTVGQPVIWTYVLRNAGNVPLFDLVVLDDKGESPFRQSGDVNGNGVLDVGEVWTYAAPGIAVEGQYKNIARVTARDPNRKKVTDEDPSHYLGIPRPVEPSEDEEPPPHPPRVRGEFEFQYDCVLSGPNGLTLKNGYKHSVPFAVNYNNDPPTITGGGEYSDDLTVKRGFLGGGTATTMSETPGGPRVFVLGGRFRISAPGRNTAAAGRYTNEGFRQVEQATNKKELFGELIKSQSGEEKLEWGFVETFAQGGPGSKNGPWTFPLEDGYEREFPDERPVGGIRMKRTFKITLHLEDE